ncbi:extensin family protein [Rhizorhapis sp.]|uniref:extensin-like domain-containing protein n=1 Tax=Rhizorhapis sp. TaxID=1968842 RepID=UPI002B486F8D|nr:extensin family protein [Rhizorhapis sp.]HKR15840.1 extensin family protein [Rhizorhapis sp.]
MILWERAVVQPSARWNLDAPVVQMRHFGSYACRRIYGGRSGGWSEHARANAIDIGRFDLADGRRISVAASWNDGTAEQKAFLREVRDGACQLFATVLGPEYNEVHQDHFHLDQARAGPNS